MAWDINLCLESWGKVIVPFYYFVKPWSQTNLSPTPPCQFSFFRRLPVDIQLIIYEHCDLSTLFQLMRTCTHTRGPASRLFWANATSGNYWYHIDDNLFRDPYPVMYHCPEFARRLTCIEVDFIRIEMAFGNYTPTGTRLIDLDKAQDFWDRMGKAFPSVKRVALAGITPNEPSVPKESAESLSTIETVVGYAPPHIAVYIAFQDDNFRLRPPRYALWQVAKHLEPTWQLVDDQWTPTRILLPRRKFPDTRLGNLLSYVRTHIDHRYEVRGLDWLKIESYARYALDGMIRCPRLSCDATFTERSQWEQHCKDCSSPYCLELDGKEIEVMSHLWVFKGTPAAVQAAINAREQLLDEKDREAKKLAVRIGWAWGWGERESQREHFEEELRAEMIEENPFAPGELITRRQFQWDWEQCLLCHFSPYGYYDKNDWAINMTQRI